MKNFNKAFTLIEVIIAIIILSIIGGVATISVQNIVEQNRVNETLKRLETLKKILAGDPNLISNGLRTDYGYYGTNRISLTPQPTWQQLSQYSGLSPSEFQYDAWGNDFLFDWGSGPSSPLKIYSSKDPSRLYVNVFNRQSDFNTNIIQGDIRDWNGNPPASSDLSNISIVIYNTSPTHPYYSGYPTAPSVIRPNANGSYVINNVPIGNYKVCCIHSNSSLGTLTKLVSVFPNSQNTVNFRYNATLPGTTPPPPPPPAPTGLVLVSTPRRFGTLVAVPVKNVGSTPVKVGSLTLSFKNNKEKVLFSEVDIYCRGIRVPEISSSPFYEATGIDLGIKSGASKAFSRPIVINPGQIVTFNFYAFCYYFPFFPIAINYDKIWEISVTFYEGGSISSRVQ